MAAYLYPASDVAEYAQIQRCTLREWIKRGYFTDKVVKRKSYLDRNEMEMVRMMATLRKKGYPLDVCVRILKIESRKPNTEVVSWLDVVEDLVKEADYWKKRHDEVAQTFKQFRDRTVIKERNGVNGDVDNTKTCEYCQKEFSRPKGIRLSVWKEILQSRLQK